jgi:phosphoribosylanthranilate isomerase
MKTKVCGLTNYSNITELASLDIDFIGFIFYKKSPRYIGTSLGFDEARQIPARIKKVGVFVDADVYGILNAIAHYDLDLVQLHGNESPEKCAELRSYARVIKAFTIGEDFDFGALTAFETSVDHFLFDAPGLSRGGNGKAFDHRKLEQYSLPVPYFLSGGLEQNVLEDFMKLDLPKPFALDINSKFETTTGVKDVQKINGFLKQVKSYGNN